MNDNRDVIALAVGNTYDIVTRTSVTAHPARAPYPKASYSLLIPIQKGGYMEEIYDVLSIVECPPHGLYRFYIMARRANIKQPFIRKNIQVSVKLNSSEIPTV